LSSLRTPIFSKRLLEQFRKTVVFLGGFNEKGEIAPQATGFLVTINNIFPLVTAKHVVFDIKKESFIDNSMLMFFNTLDGKIQLRSIDQIKSSFECNWIFHQNREVDIAIMPFGYDQQNDDVRFVPDNVFLSAEQLYEVYDIFFLSYQPGIRIQQKILPIFRSGIISLMNEDYTFYIDAAAFPGNSGSPVFLKPSLLYSETEVSTIGGGRFVGVIGEYITYEEVAFSLQTQRPRVVFEENTGLSKVWSISFIREITESKDFRDQIDRISKPNQPT
jgi:hypothetical protein